MPLSPAHLSPEEEAYLSRVDDLSETELKRLQNYVICYGMIRRPKPRP